MNNLLSYCGLVDAKKRASDKDLPVATKAMQYCLWSLRQKKDTKRAYIHQRNPTFQDFLQSFSSAYNLQAVQYCWLQSDSKKCHQIDC